MEVEDGRGRLQLAIVGDTVTKGEWRTFLEDLCSPRGERVLVKSNLYIYIRLKQRWRGVNSEASTGESADEIDFVIARCD